MKADAVGATPIGGRVEAVTSNLPLVSARAHSRAVQIRSPCAVYSTGRLLLCVAVAPVD